MAKGLPGQRLDGQVLSRLEIFMISYMWCNVRDNCSQ